MSAPTKIIAVATQKGGAGKSTIAVHLAVEALRSKKSAQVVLLDLDPQGSVAGWAQRRDLGDPIVLSALPANLGSYLDHARSERIDWVIIDTPPHAGATIDAAVRAADLVVIPIRPGPFDIDAAAGTVEILAQTGGKGLFVLSQVAPRGSEGDDAAEVLAGLYPGLPIAKARLGQRKAFMQALISGQAITEFERPSAKSVGEIQALFREVRNSL